MKTVEKKYVIGFENEKRIIKTYIEQDKSQFSIESFSGIVYKNRFFIGPYKFSQISSINLYETNVYKGYTKKDDKKEIIPIYRLTVTVLGKNFIVDECRKNSFNDKNLVYIRLRAEKLSDLLKAQMIFNLKDSSRSIRNYYEINKPFYYFLKFRKDLSKEHLNPVKRIEFINSENGDFILKFKQTLLNSKNIFSKVILVFFFMLLNYGNYKFYNLFLLKKISISTVNYSILSVMVFLSLYIIYFMLNRLKINAEIEVNRVNLIYKEKILFYKYSKAISNDKLEEILVNANSNRIIFFTDEFYYLVRTDRNMVQDLHYMISFALYKLFY